MPQIETTQRAAPVTNLFEHHLRPANCHDGEGTVDVFRPYLREPGSALVDHIDVVGVHPGSSIGRHRHGDNTEWYVIMSGQATIWFDNAEREVGPGDVLINPPYGEHGLVNHAAQPIQLLVFQVSAQEAAPPYANFMPNSAPIGTLSEHRLRPANQHRGTGNVDLFRTYARVPGGELVDHIDVVVMHPGATIGRHRHGNDTEWYVILAGQGTMWFDNAEREVGPGDVLINPPYGEHGLVNHSTQPIQLLVFQVSAQEAA
jgi:mannose-6-phosphate isomerase-like protein (cupin superfamily)